MDLNPLNQIDPVVIVAVVLIFWTTMIVARRLFYAPYIRVMEERDEHLRHAHELQVQAGRITDEAAEEAEGVLRSARERSERIVSQARERADRARREGLERVSQEVGATLEQGRARIAEARANELSDVRGQALTCVGLACDKLVGGGDEDRIRRTVDELIARRLQ